MGRGKKGGRETDPAPKDRSQWEGAQASRVFFKDTRQERKLEAPRGLGGKSRNSKWKSTEPAIGQGQRTQLRREDMGRNIKRTQTANLDGCF